MELLNKMAEQISDLHIKYMHVLGNIYNFFCTLKFVSGYDLKYS